MNVQTSVAGVPVRGGFAGSAAALETVLDATVCFAAHQRPRRCARCGTVYRGSVLSPLVTGYGAACPFCASGDTAPLDREPAVGTA
ncbi:MAG: hypothetical protein ACOY4F_03590 [Thermodesulfobacteriota bacterium]